MVTYEFDRTNSTPLYIQLYDKIRHDIEHGIIKPGEKLPSKRALAAQLGLSVITIENAYGQLTAEGYIRSVPKKGYYAQRIDGTINRTIPVPDTFASEPEAETEENESFPFTVWARLMREQLSSNQHNLLTKPPVEGVFELRRAIAAHLKSFRSINAAPEQIIIGAGTEYLYMLINLLFGSNYVFAAEDPGYSKIADIYANYKIKCEHIPVLSDGIDMDYLRSIKADILHISPSHHFPTGAITPVGKRYLLLEWASQSPDRYIMEDDYDSEFRLSGKPIPSMYSIDVMDKVIYMNTFSKSLASTIRISYMVLPPSILKKFKEKLGFYSCPVSTFEQYTLASFIGGGYFEKHINRMRSRYKRRRSDLFERMKRFDIFKGSVISGENSGLHCVVKFAGDDDDDDEVLLDKITALGFHAASMKKYYYNPPAKDLHSLIFFY